MVQMTFTLSERDLARIERVVAGGHYLNKSDFARTAVRGQLDVVTRPENEHQEVTDGDE